MKGNVINSVKNGITGGNAVRSMSLIETIGAGAIGAGGVALMNTVLPNLNGWIKPAVEVGAGVLGGAIFKNEFGKLWQSGLVISGMSQISDFAVSFIKNKISGGSAAVADTNAVSTTLY